MTRDKAATNDFMAHIGARIWVLRLERGLTMQSLAQSAECSAERINQIEMGRSAITTRIMVGLARALRVQPFDILNYNPQTDDLGYVIERMRHDPGALRLVRDKLERKRSSAGVRSGSSVPAEC